MKSKKKAESSVLTCARHGRGVFNGPVETFVTVTDCSRLVVAGAVRRTLGAFSVTSKRLEEAGLTSCRQEVEDRFIKVNVSFLSSQSISPVV